jgi:hypothetical protein
MEVRGIQEVQYACCLSTKQMTKSKQFKLLLNHRIAPLKSLDGALIALEWPEFVNVDFHVFTECIFVNHE